MIILLEPSCVFSQQKVNTLQLWDDTENSQKLLLYPDKIIPASCIYYRKAGKLWRERHYDLDVGLSSQIIKAETSPDIPQDRKAS